MPAPTSRLYDTRPAIHHVNLMTDTFIANASIDDLRYISRSLLATGPAGIVPAFLHAAHARLSQTNAKAVPNTQLLFVARSCGAAPTECLHDALSRARKLFGSGMGFASLGILTTIVRATLGLRWDDEGDMADVLATIDGDITQAIQSCKEEVTCGRLNDYICAKNSVNELRVAISECQRDVGSWGGEFPFDRASSSLEFWKIGV
ncbi:hypothetical protein M378DRAFT_166666 [Amanita muscaria Koide BX008]|uniref:Uncharacterized protein n=1 Tax=Amanita muscaria (strain Koide BX008) TaxID=946122 RepID=A0A0C2WZ58_AMAMK|nr:hypothetical protein M378DRAFT_166666 [Amanita muscaria Koide BX008]